MKFTRKYGRAQQGFATSALPDVIFMLLFFFMTAATRREPDRLVAFTLPEASQAARIERKHVGGYIYVGTPLEAYQPQRGGGVQIQLNDAFREASDIAGFIAAERGAAYPSGSRALTVSLKIDEDVRMGVVSDIKQELRRADALIVVYSTSNKLK
ncbi:MAG: biopolymer transporter ExbD [Prevotellaceae bacterium]|jgi:biopolymer transport protein ExbD|nr:biopolymer transporter ExbD [Prevotellaceae bacterium]